MFKNSLIIVLLSLLCCANATAGDIIPGWNLINPSGYIYDMELMPDNNYFILTTRTDIQIRQTSNGELINSYPKTDAYNSEIEFTPDSTKIVLINGPKIELRNLSDMSIISSDTLLQDPDGYPRVFTRLVVDPVRPYAYTLIQKQNPIPPHNDTLVLVIYNYQTMSKVGEFSNSKYNQPRGCGLPCLAISKSGDHIALNNSGESHLKIWSLPSQSLIKDWHLADLIETSGTWAYCMKFSEINTDHLYVSGSFKKKDDEYIGGTFNYSISQDKIIDSTFIIGSKRISGVFVFFDYEERIMVNDGQEMIVANLQEKNIEMRRQASLQFPASEKIISFNDNNFLGFSDELFTMYTYDENDGVNDLDTNAQIVYPNPTTNVVNIPVIGIVPQVNYKLINSTGQVLQDKTISISNGTIQIDISQFPYGVYYIRVFIGSSFRTYKVVKG